MSRGHNHLSSEQRDFSRDIINATLDTNEVVWSKSARAARPCCVYKVVFRRAMVLLAVLRHRLQIGKLRFHIGVLRVCLGFYGGMVVRAGLLSLRVRVPTFV
eukprot:scaffold114393_cov15-Prasinocladus_malaysianus.AAC.1